MVLSYTDGQVTHHNYRWTKYYQSQELGLEVGSSVKSSYWSNKDQGLIPSTMSAVSQAHAIPVFREPIPLAALGTSIHVHTYTYIHTCVNTHAHTLLES